MGRMPSAPLNESVSGSSGHRRKVLGGPPLIVVLLGSFGTIAAFVFSWGPLTAPPSTPSSAAPGAVVLAIFVFFLLLGATTRWNWSRGAWCGS